MIEVVFLFWKQKIKRFGTSGNRPQSEGDANGVVVQENINATVSLNLREWR